MFTMSKIGDWLLLELGRRGWNQSDLARNARLSKSAISGIISGRRNIGRDMAISIAEALDLPIDDVLRAAGMLPSVIESKLVKQIDHLSAQLDEEEQAGLIEYIKMRLKIQRGKK